MRQFLAAVAIASVAQAVALSEEEIVPRNAASLLTITHTVSTTSNGVAETMTNTYTGGAELLCQWLNGDIDAEDGASWCSTGGDDDTGDDGTGDDDTGDDDNTTGGGDDDAGEPAVCDADAFYASLDEVRDGLDAYFRVDGYTLM